MKAVPQTARVHNISRRERCRHCDDGGYVVAMVRQEGWSRRVPKGKGSKETELCETVAAVEEYAPCPFCERGLAEEFPDLSRATKSEPISSPWGEHGYWQGREPVDIRLLNASDNRPLRKEENAQRLLELRERMGYIAKEIADA